MTHETTGETTLSLAEIRSRLLNRWTPDLPVQDPLIFARILSQLSAAHHDKFRSTIQMECPTTTTTRKLPAASSSLSSQSSGLVQSPNNNDNSMTAFHDRVEEDYNDDCPKCPPSTCFVCLLDDSIHDGQPPIISGSPPIGGGPPPTINSRGFTCVVSDDFRTFSLVFRLTRTHEILIVLIFICLILGGLSYALARYRMNKIGCRRGGRNRRDLEQQPSSFTMINHNDGNPNNGSIQLRDYSTSRSIRGPLQQKQENRLSPNRPRLWQTWNSKDGLFNCDNNDVNNLNNNNNNRLASISADCPSVVQKTLKNSENVSDETDRNEIRMESNQESTTNHGGGQKAQTNIKDDPVGRRQTELLQLNLLLKNRNVQRHLRELNRPFDELFRRTTSQNHRTITAGQTAAAAAVDSQPKNNQNNNNNIVDKTTLNSNTTMNNEISLQQQSHQPPANQKPRPAGNSQDHNHTSPGAPLSSFTTNKNTVISLV